jgi:hypothetical protein
MPGTVLFTLKDPAEQIALLLNVPAEFTASQVLTEVIDVTSLDCLDKAGQPVRYVLQRKVSGEFLSPHTSIGQAKILRGETVYLHRTVSGDPYGYIGAPDWEDEEDYDDLVDLDFLEDGTPRPATHQEHYWQEVYKFIAAGAYEKALAVLLDRWLVNYKRLKSASGLAFRLAGPSNLTLGAKNAGNELNNPEQENQVLLEAIQNQFLDLINEQVKSTSFETFYNLLQSEAVGVFLNANPDIKDRLVDLLLEASYELSRLYRYQNSRDLAILALHLDPASEMAQTLESLAHQYVTLLATDDRQERLELARAIYQVDSGYGNIGEDLRLFIRQSRGGPAEENAEPALRAETEPPAPMGPEVVIPPALNAFIAPPVKKRQTASFFQRNYLWIMLFFSLVTFILLLMWVLSG